MLFVTKADGSKQPFDKQKIFRTCIRLRATNEAAQSVADRIEEKARSGITTKEILQTIFHYMKEYRPEVRYITDLREAIAFMRPQPDFEQYVAMLLKEQGYDVVTNQLVKGKCVEHEVDAIARKKNECIYVEVKHHFQHHTFTGIGVFLEAWASYVDLLQGFEEAKNSYHFNKVMVVCNTKISEHAKQYSICKGIMYTGWNYPAGNSMEEMIQKKSLYPITFLKSIDRRIEAKLGDAGVITLRQLVETNMAELASKTNVEKAKLRILVEKAREILA